MYSRHFVNARRVRIAWQLSLPQYAEIVGPHIDKAWRKNRVVLGRKNKNGPFSKDNVEVTTLHENSRQTQIQVNAEKNRKRILKLRDSGRSVAEIANATKLSESTVDMCLYRDKNEKEVQA